MSELKKQEPRNPFPGSMPKIGIRPAIDGREAVRQSEKETTIEMAEMAAEFLEENLTHPNGMPVECVVADRCIGGVKEAREAGEKFRQENVGVSITVSPVWCYGSETMDMNPEIPKAVWGFNATERPGAVYLAALKSAHDQKGLPIFPIYGRHVQDDMNIPGEVQKKLLRFARAGLAVARMKDKSYLSIGGVSMGIASSVIKESFFQDYLGMRNEYVDMSEVTRRLEEKIYDEEEYKKALDWVEENCEEGEDNNPEELKLSRQEKDEVWKTVVKMTLIMRDLMTGNSRLKDKGYEEESLGHNALAAGFQGQREWTDHMPNGDFSEAILNSSFDWNGIRQPYLLATENDALNGISMLFNHLLTGSAQIFADVRTYWSPRAVKRVTGYELSGRAEKGIIHLKNSGPAALDGSGMHLDEEGNNLIKPHWQVTPEDAERCLEATTWRPAALDYMRGGGFSSEYKTKGGLPLTMTRINIIKGQGPVLQIAEGYSIELPEEVHNKLDERTDPTWPTTWFVPKLTERHPFNDTYEVMNNWGSNHGAISYGHIGDRLITLASMLRIPVSMHNVERDRIFRPSAWSAFGAMDAQGADFRACDNFGPLYG